MEQIKQYIKEGKTYSEIARIVGRSAERIRQICNKEGWKRKPFNYEIPKEPSRLSILRASGKPWCMTCKHQDVHLIKAVYHHDKQFYICGGCNGKRSKAYYRTESGKKAILRANKKYLDKKA